MKRFSGIAALGVALMVGSLCFAAGEPQLEGLTCPISGKAVVAASATDYKGGTIYFCCTKCPKGFAADSDKFAAKANHQLVASGQATQEKCPLTGKDLNPATKIEVSGAAVAFCCNNCKGKAAAAGDGQIELLFNDAAFEKGFVVKKSE